MPNIWEILLTLLILVYILLWYKNRYYQESFTTMEEDKYFINAHTYEAIYDDFYGFIYDDLFYQKEYYLSLCEVLLQYLNSVYNNHLCIGIKHGGHINEILKNNMNTTSISRSSALVNICKHHYPSNDYKYIPTIETNPYIFDEHEFTHISLIDNELYYLSNLPGFFYNCSRWLILKGYLFIQCYHNKADLKSSFIKVGENSSVRTKTVYTHEFRDYQNNHSFSLLETLKNKKKERNNRHTLFFYQKEYIESVGTEFGLKKVDLLPLSKQEGILVFQKI